MNLLFRKEGALINVQKEFSDPYNSTAPCVNSGCFSGTINWGDDSGIQSTTIAVTRAGTASLPTLGVVTASHRYANEGDFVITVCVFDEIQEFSCDNLTAVIRNDVPTVEAGVPRYVRLYYLC